MCPKILKPKLVSPRVLGTVVENVLARVTVDDRTGRFMSLEYTKHTNETGLHLRVLSVRDTRTLHLYLLTSHAESEAYNSRSKRSLHYLLTRPHT